MSERKKDPAEDTSDREIVISRVFNALRELVWKAWTDPKHVVNWWGPKGFTTTIEVMDVRPGGMWNHVMHGPDGTNFPNRIIFKEVVRPERIVFSNAGEKEGGPGVLFESTWTFEEKGKNKTEVTIRMVFETRQGRELVVKEFGAVEGAKQTLGRLAEYLPQAELGTFRRTIEFPTKRRQLMTATKCNPKIVWTGRILSVICTLPFIFASSMKLMMNPEVIKGMAHAGLPENLIRPIGIIGEAIGSKELP